MSLQGLDVPDDPFSDEPFHLEASAAGLELRSAGTRPSGVPLGYRLER